MREQNTNRMSNKNEDGGAGERKYYFQIDGKEASTREYARVLSAQSPEYSEEEVQAALEENAPKPFSILRWR